MKKNVYGTNQEHIEPRFVKEVLIPLPKDQELLKRLGLKVIEGIQHLAKAQETHSSTRGELTTLFDP